MVKNNFFGQVLIGLLVLFMLISSIQMFGWGQGLKEVNIDSDAASTLPVVPKEIATAEKIAAADTKKLMAEIIKRPMFSQDRKPFVPPVEEEPKDENGPIEAKELKAKLTGVVITPEQSYAIILDNLTNERNTYKVGMPLEGEQGAWMLDSIQSRKVVFVSEDKKTEELELEIYSGQAKKPVKNQKGKAGVTANKAKKLSKRDKKKNADDIRKKIAERRAQMRAQAAKKKKR